jgi:hypothetical protein
MRSALVALLGALVLAPAAHADTTSTDSPRDPNLPPSQDFSHVSSSFEPASGTWSVAYTFFGPPTSAGWGNLNAQLYTGASQCADFQALRASYQETPTLPGDGAISGIVLPPPERNVRPAETLDKRFDGNTITLTMSDSSLVGAAPTCVAAAITHRGFLDTVGPLAFASAPPPKPTPAEPNPPPALAIALKSTHLNTSKGGVVRIGLKPFDQAVSGVVTLREGGKQIARKAYRAKSGAAVTVAITLSAAARRSLRRHRSLLVNLTVTAQAGTQLVAKAVRARVRR